MKENNTPLISVIIPFYNRVSLVVESIQSVLDQTYQNFEILLVDDGSTESIVDVERISNSDERIYLYKGEHKGVSDARNLASRHARGEFIAFLDSDDLFQPKKLEIQVRYMLKNHLDFSHTSYETIDMAGRPREIIHSGLFDGQVYPRIISGCPLATPTIMVRSHVFKEKRHRFKNDFHIGEDICLWIDIAQEYTIAGLDIPLSKVRISANSASIETNKQFIGLNNIYNYCSMHPIHRKNTAELEQLNGLISDERTILEKKEAFERDYESIQRTKELLKDEFLAKQFNPLVSIIIPVYNGENYLDEAIRSALLQTYPNIEVLVVNDGSRDGGITESIALYYGDRIRYIYKENGGVASALNHGIREMQGEYFSWLSHDDLYTEDKIESQIRLLAEEGDKKRIVFGGYDLFRDNDPGIFGTMNPNAIEYPEKLSVPLYPVFRGLLNGCTMLIHKSHFERVGGFDESLPTTQDYDLWFRMLRGQSAICQPGIHMKSRCHKEQGSRTLSHKNEAENLWRNMMDAVDKDECIQMDGDEYIFYKNLYLFLKTNLPQNKHAWGHAKRKAIDILCERIAKQENEAKEIPDICGLPFDNIQCEQLVKLICHGSKVKRIAFVVFGKKKDKFIHRMRLIEQLCPEGEYCLIWVDDSVSHIRLDKTDMHFSEIEIPKKLISKDTVPTLMALLQVNCAIEFNSVDTEYVSDYNLSILDHRYIIYYDAPGDMVFNMWYECVSDAWMVISLEERNKYLDVNLIKNHFTDSYDFVYSMEGLIQELISGKELYKTQWYQRYKDMYSQASNIDKLMEEVFNSDNKKMSRIVAECEKCRAMEKTISWRITKPLRLMIRIRRKLKANGILKTILECNKVRHNEN